MGELASFGAALTYNDAASVLLGKLVDINQHGIVSCLQSRLE